MSAVVVGDLGCLGIDVEKWLADNRAPLFPGQVNRWLLARTLRDDPSDSMVKQTLLEVMAVWFPGGVWLIDPLLETSEGGRTGAVDGLRIVNASKDGRATFKDIVKSREQCTIIPTVEGAKGVLFVEVVFNYRSPLDNIAWPVYNVNIYTSKAFCPDKADWMLVAVGSPEGKAGPPKSTATIASELIFKPLGDVTETAVATLLRPALLPIWIALGIWGYSKLRGDKRG